MDTTQIFKERIEQDEDLYKLAETIKRLEYVFNFPREKSIKIITNYLKERK
ncbi:MAG: hypothetical protein ACOX6V_05055 [Patescibacteria group bacterium]|jgi:hypothetical protein